MGLDIDYFWYHLTPRQAFNIAHGYGRRKKREFEAAVFVERKLHTIILNMFQPKGKQIKEQKYWPLSMDKEVEEYAPNKKKGNELNASAFLQMFAKLGEKVDG